MTDEKTKGKMMPVRQTEEDEDMVVVATALDNPTAFAATSSSISAIKGDLQPPAFRDWPFAVLFWVQVAAIAVTAFSFGPAMFKSSGASSDSEFDFDNHENNNGDFSDDYYNNNSNNNEESSSSSTSSIKWGLMDSLFFLVGTFFAASLVTMGAFRIMVHHPLRTIQVSFFVAPVTFGVVALALLAPSMSASKDENNAIDPIMISFWAAAAFFSLISICYYFCFKRFMPFAAINLRVALSAVRVNTGLFSLAFASIFVIYAWSVLWIVAFGGVVYHDQQKSQVPCQDDEYHTQGQMCDQQPSTAAVFLLLLCLYWTQQVIQNTVHTTTAGAVSSWWVQAASQEDDEIIPHQSGGGCFGSDVSDSLYRSTTYSFGSICFGSLLVAIIQTLERMARNRNRRDLLSLVLQCLIMCFRAYLEYFNSWAFVFVGVYGYGYLDAGRKVIELFKARGWTTLITDRLIFRVLLLAHLGIAALTGALSVLIMAFLAMTKIETSDGWAVALLIAFWIGFVVGLLISSTVLFVVESSVRTIMVCFAEQPAGNSQMVLDMQETYAATYPGVFVFNEQELHERSGRSVV